MDVPSVPPSGNTHCCFPSALDAAGKLYELSKGIIAGRQLRCTLKHFSSKIRVLQRESHPKELWSRAQMSLLVQYTEQMLHWAVGLTPNKKLNSSPRFCMRLVIDFPRSYIQRDIDEDTLFMDCLSDSLCTTTPKRLTWKAKKHSPSKIIIKKTSYQNGFGNESRKFHKNSESVMKWKQCMGQKNSSRIYLFIHTPAQEVP